MEVYRVKRVQHCKWRHTCRRVATQSKFCTVSFSRRAQTLLCAWVGVKWVGMRIEKLCQTEHESLFNKYTDKKTFHCDSVGGEVADMEWTTNVGDCRTYTHHAYNVIIFADLIRRKTNPPTLSLSLSLSLPTGMILYAALVHLCAQPDHHATRRDTRRTTWRDRA